MQLNTSKNIAIIMVMLCFSNLLFSQNNFKVIVTNATGQELGKYELSKGSNSIKIQTTGLNKGLYFIKVIGDNHLSIGKLMVN